MPKKKMTKGKTAGKPGAIKYGDANYRALVSANDKEKSRKIGGRRGRRTRPLSKAIGTKGGSKIKRNR